MRQENARLKASNDDYEAPFRATLGDKTHIAMLKAEIDRLKREKEEANHKVLQLSMTISDLERQVDELRKALAALQGPVNMRTAS